MPTMTPAENGLSLSEALLEAAMYAPVARAMLITYEVWHPSMTVPVRVVVDHAPLTATLEAGAPRNAGAAVTFTPANVSYERPPESDEAKAPEINLRIDNVTGLIGDALRRARLSVVPAVRDASWQLIERVYASDDTSGPAQLPVLKLTLTKVSRNDTVAVFTAAYRDSVNFSVPAITFTPENYSGLNT